MFKRRKPLPYHRRLRDLVWPRRGFQRSTKYIAHRLRRLPGTPYRIAAGFASGAAVSFTPFLGLHFVMAALFALALRGSLVASAIGTVVGNPWTFPFIWAWLYSSGHWLLGNDVSDALPHNLSIRYVFDNFWAVLWPMTVSGIPTSIAAWFAFFLPARRMVAEYQRARRWRIRRKVLRRRKSVKGNTKKAESRLPPGDGGAAPGSSHAAGG